jgi:hypothetical protein
LLLHEVHFIKIALKFEHFERLHGRSIQEKTFPTPALTQKNPIAQVSVDLDGCSPVGNFCNGSQQQVCSTG